MQMRGAEGLILPHLVCVSFRVGAFRARFVLFLNETTGV